MKTNDDATHEPRLFFSPQITAVQCIQPDKYFSLSDVALWDEIRKNRIKIVLVFL
jgi:hypothetical protein